MTNPYISVNAWDLAQFTAPRNANRLWLPGALQSYGFTEARVAGIHGLSYHAVADALATMLAHKLRPLLVLNPVPVALRLWPGEPWSPPADTAVWAALNCSLLTFLYAEFGAQVAGWRLEYWNEPEAFWPWSQYQGARHDAGWLDWYATIQATAHGVHWAEQITGLQWSIGGPSMGPAAALQLAAYLTKVGQGEIRSDFIAAHFYAWNHPDDVEQAASPPVDTLRRLQMLRALMSAAKCLTFNDQNNTPRPIIVTEFGPDGTGTWDGYDDARQGAWFRAAWPLLDSAVDYCLSSSWRQAPGAVAGKIGLFYPDGTPTPGALALAA